MLNISTSLHSNFKQFSGKTASDIAGILTDFGVIGHTARRAYGTAHFVIRFVGPILVHRSNSRNCVDAELATLLLQALKIANDSGLFSLDDQAVVEIDRKICVHLFRARWNFCISCICNMLMCLQGRLLTRFCICIECSSMDERRGVLRTIAKNSLQSGIESLSYLTHRQLNYLTMTCIK